MPLADFLPSKRVIKGLFLCFLTTVIAAGVPLTFPHLFQLFFLDRREEFSAAINQAIIFWSDAYSLLL